MNFKPAEGKILITLDGQEEEKNGIVYERKEMQNKGTVAFSGHEDIKQGDRVHINLSHWHDWTEIMGKKFFVTTYTGINAVLEG